MVARYLYVIPSKFSGAVASVLMCMLYRGLARNDILSAETAA